MGVREKTLTVLASLVPAVLRPGHISAEFHKAPMYMNFKNCLVWLSKFKLDSCGYLQLKRTLTSTDLKGFSQHKLGCFWQQVTTKTNRVAHYEDTPYLS